MELDIKRERVIDSIAEHRETGKDLGGRPQLITAASAMPVDPPPGIFSGGSCGTIALGTARNRVDDDDLRVFRSPSGLRIICSWASGVGRYQGTDWSESEPIISARLSLKPLSAQHAPSMVEVLADPSLYEYTGREIPS